eukprot:scaffold108441_cov25-Tisochrysis_lutea.AAC.2
MHLSRSRIARPLRASLMRNQRPSRCSCPTAAATNLPLGAIAIPLTKPLSGVCPMGSRQRASSSARQNRTNPSHEPDTWRTITIAGTADTVRPRHGRERLLAQRGPEGDGAVLRPGGEDRRGEHRDGVDGRTTAAKEELRLLSHLPEPEGAVLRSRDEQLLANGVERRHALLMAEKCLDEGALRYVPSADASIRRARVEFCRRGVTPLREGGDSTAMTGERLDHA